MLARFSALIFGLLLNAFGNSLTIVSGFGAGVWTATAINLNHIVDLSVGNIIFIFGIFSIIVNQILIKRIEFIRAVNELIFILFFSRFIDLFTNILIYFKAEELPWYIRIFLSIMGVTFFCISISVYQRANLVMHPNDDTTNLLRFMYLKGSAIWSQLIDFIPPILLTIICVLIDKKIYGYNVGTIYSIVFNGVLIDWSDRKIFPALVHNFKKPMKTNKHTA
ncbi:hypothetical protein ACKP2L_02275 [Oenococcus alcoholitolerans]|uniref:hypothetical protein n=1 Tax=Oenococcus alcoholitolerans TaxID=931074 RepID=UPI003F7152AD